jgi:hypothetical protein
MAFVTYFDADVSGQRIHDTSMNNTLVSGNKEDKCIILT